MSFLETRGTLARLLATENLVVEHDNNAKTACFDTDNRVLKLPVLKTESEFVYNMFVGHEVGHALQTPNKWKDDVPEDLPFDFVNVVEDVRIEKYIQNKFPGLRRDFTKGYDQLNEKDFFDIVGKDISQMSLIDRINLHFKLGARALVPFTDEEKVYVTAVDEADTWQKVLLAATMIHGHIGNNKVADNDDMTGEESGSGGESQQSQSNSNSSDSGDTESPDNSQGDSSSDSVDEEVSQTQRSFDDAIGKMTNNQSFENKVVYVNYSGVDSSKYIVDINTLRESMIYPDSTDWTNHVREQYNKFMKDIKSDVNHLVQQFEMKKSADAYARQQVNKTGVLDTNVLHTYKLSDDIFLRQSVLPDGKNHGMVMYLDWSGSMHDICLETVKQILILVQFCRKAQLPFEVYTFTTGDRNYSKLDLSLDMTPAHSNVQLIQVLSSTAKKTEIDKDMFHFYCAGTNNSYVPHSPWFAMGGTPLNNALLLVPDIIKRFRANTGAQKVSFVCVTDGESSPIIWYQKTDHDTIRETYAYYETVILRDGHKTYPIKSESRGTTDIVNWLKTQLDDVSISHLFLAGVAGSARYVRSITNHEQIMNEKVFRKEGCATVTSDSWPLIGCINPKSLHTTVDEMNVDDNASKAQIKNALKKYLKSKSSSRLVLNQLVSQFS